MQFMGDYYYHVKCLELTERDLGFDIDLLLGCRFKNSAKSNRHKESPVPPYRSSCMWQNRLRLSATVGLGGVEEYLYVHPTYVISFVIISRQSPLFFIIQSVNNTCGRGFFVTGCLRYDRWHEQSNWPFFAQTSGCQLLDYPWSLFACEIWRFQQLLLFLDGYTWVVSVWRFVGSMRPFSQKAAYPFNSGTTVWYDLRWLGASYAQIKVSVNNGWNITENILS